MLGRVNELMLVRDEIAQTEEMMLGFIDFSPPLFVKQL